MADSAGAPAVVLRGITKRYPGVVANDDIKTKLDDYKQQIIDGKIEVPTKP